ncbi:hypothetical protein SAMN05421837_107317 [Amycolatopsis pretoriensis]|uniref:Uncharacterized protein n=1 Tax=Amycolatopsis pretoriensis TaxID=218821 RepID=A0A1H5R8B9_9PSEU|nr:hypothetical protein [Amycolatopsis pretoriensis]SEF34314.1 hypothetical protein SAMN05421837_107317 [Amycolatopsis pretoriensis]
MDIEIVRTSEGDDDEDAGYVVLDGVIQIVAANNAPQSDVDLWAAIALVREDPRYRGK